MFPVLACPSAREAESRRARVTTHTKIFLIVMHPPFLRRGPLRLRVFAHVPSSPPKSNTTASAARRRASGREEPHDGRRNPERGRRAEPAVRRFRNVRGAPRSWIVMRESGSTGEDVLRKCRASFREQGRGALVESPSKGECRDERNEEKDEDRSIADGASPSAGSNRDSRNRTRRALTPSSGSLENLLPRLAYESCK